MNVNLPGANDEVCAYPRAFERLFGKQTSDELITINETI